MIDTLNGALLLKRSVFLHLRESPTVVWRGLMMILFVGVLVGGVHGVQAFFATLNPDYTYNQIQREVETIIDQQARESTLDEQRQILGIVDENLDPAIALLKRIDSLPTPLPRPVEAVVRGIAVFVSMPLQYLQGVLIAAIFTHFAACVLGGQGSIQQMIGVGALSTAPHALDALKFVNVLGDLITPVAWAWGFVVLVVATSVVHRLELVRAAIATIFFPLLLLLLTPLFCIVSSLVIQLLLAMVA
jgi:hypothetical protein